CSLAQIKYPEYEAANKRRLWDDVRSRRSPINYNEVDVDSFHQNKKEDQKEDGDDGDTFDMWDITVEDADFNPTKDLEELERLLAKEAQLNFTEIQVDRDIISPGRCPQLDQTATNEAQMIEEMIGQD
ncbi:hypothetical protein Tco_0813671, partial [Tanacetum coccineum]